MRERPTDKADDDGDLIFWRPITSDRHKLYIAEAVDIPLITSAASAATEALQSCKVLCEVAADSFG